jgi:hypothetical protein
MATSTSVSSSLTDVPDILKPYLTDKGGVLPTAQATVGGKSYDELYGTSLQKAGLAGAGRVAALSPFQTDVGTALKGMQVPGQYAQGTAAAQSGIESLGRAANAFGNIGNVNAQGLNQYQMAAPQNVSSQGATGYQMAAPQNVSAQNLNQYQMSGPDQYNNAAVSQYMTPYMQQVVDVQKEQAMRDAQKQLTGANLASSRQGTYGGARNALLQSEANRNLQTQMGNIQATGSQQAFQNAQGQFNTAQQAQQAANQANLQAALGVQQLGSGQSLQAQLANQAANQAAGQTNLQALINQGQFGSTQSMQAQLANQAANQAAGQTNLQALLGIQQLGAGQSMDAQKANQAAQLQAAQGYGQIGTSLGNIGSTLGALGTAQQAGQMDITKAQGAYGDLQRNVQQNQLDAQYSDLMSRLNQPLTNIETMSNLARGIPLTQTAGTQTTTTPPPSFASQLAGTGLTGLSLYNMFGK